MEHGKTVFAQLMDFLPSYEFRKCVERYDGHFKVKSFSCWDQFLAMAFAQLTFRESLRDIEACLLAARPKLYHLGFRSPVYRNTLANANQVRDWRIYADFAQVLIGIARPLYVGEDLGADLANTAYALDSTTIDLCLALFPWAKFRKAKGGVKLHTLMDLRGSIPTVVFVTNAKTHDVNILDVLPVEPGAIYIMDRGYLDFARLYAVHQARGFFITRARSNFNFSRLCSRPADASIGIRCDQIVTPRVFYSRKGYQEKLRRIRFHDAEKGSHLVFLTNHFELPAEDIVRLYRCRWQIELFFKWIKQHLRIKAFYGTSENAVKAQIWIAISIYVLVAIVKKRLKLDVSLYTVLQVLSISLFEKMPITQAFAPFNITGQINHSANQLNLFE